MKTQFCRLFLCVSASLLFTIGGPSLCAQEQKPNVPAQTQDDAYPILAAADAAVAMGDKERAYALCEKALLLPAKPGAHPPMLAPGPLDLRGEARWKMAQIRRLQGRWSEALALYQLNRQTYPRDDGCVRSGAAAQEMAMVEGECLEHLGRFDEAVVLYFPAALYLSADVKPEAMCRLFDIYSQCNQIVDLERNIEREKAVYKEKLKREWAEIGNIERSQQIFDQSAFPTYERIHHFKTLAQARKWGEFVRTFLPTSLDEEVALEWQGSEWDWREALMTLLALDTPLRSQALRVLNGAVKRDMPTEAINTKLDVAIAVLQGPKGPYIPGNVDDDQVQKFLGYPTISDFAPRQPTPIPQGLKLPSVLPSVM